MYVKMIKKISTLNSKTNFQFRITRRIVLKFYLSFVHLRVVDTSFNIKQFNNRNGLSFQTVYSCDYGHMYGFKITRKKQDKQHEN